jgi:large subunit ribosomal protein L3
MKVNEDFVKAHEVGKALDASLLEWVTEVTVVGTSKGKGYQGPMKRHHAHGTPGTHGHKFTRAGWSKGNRKPRRGFKGHPHAGHMWDERITLKHIQVLDSVAKDNEHLLVLKWSLPGAYNGTLRLLLD